MVVPDSDKGSGSLAETELRLPNGYLKITTSGSPGQSYTITLLVLSEDRRLLKTITANTKALNDLRLDWPYPELIEAGIDSHDASQVREEIYEYLSRVVPTILVVKIRGTFLASPSWEKGKFQPASIRGPIANLGDPIPVDRVRVVGGSAVVKDGGSWKWISFPQQKSGVFKPDARW